MRVIKKRKKKRFLVLKFLTVGICAYIIFVLVNQQIQINQKKSELDDLNNKVSIQNIKNEEMKRILNSDEKENLEYIERIAREDLDFVKEGEQVFVNVAGN